jgi:hypothetical protein
VAEVVRDERAALFQFLRRAWLELRFIGHAVLQRDFNDPRVQKIVEEKLRG